MRTCPDHSGSTMQPLYVAPQDGGREIQIDRCGDCGALWFDAGELEIIAAVHARASNDESPRQCPACHEPLAWARLSAQLEAHRCGRCHGTFLDRDTVAGLGHEGLPQVPEKKAPASTVGFECAGCKGRFDYRFGNGTRKGLVCPNCVVNPQVERLSPSAALDAPDHSAAEVGGLIAIDLIAGLFLG